MPAKLSSPGPAKRMNWFIRQMTATKKFMFETVFADYVPREVVVLPTAEELAEEQVEPEEIIPTFSEEELEVARTEGFQAGREEGLNTSLDSIERQISATLSNMGNAVTRLIEKQNRTNDETAHLALSVAVSIARKMLPEMASRNALDEIELVLKNVLPRLIDEPRITVRVHGDMESGVTSHLEKLIGDIGFAGQVAISPDTELEISDCRLDWSCGGADRNTTALWAEIDAIIARNFDKDLLTPPEETPVEEGIEDIHEEVAQEDIPETAQTPDAPVPEQEEVTQEDVAEVSEAILESENESGSNDITKEEEVTPEDLDPDDAPDTSPDPDLPPTTDV